MILTAATLCDFAQVRDGLLTTISGGITTIYRNELPAPIGVMTAVSLLIDASDLNSSFAVAAVLRRSESDQPGAKIEAKIDLDENGRIVLGEGAYVNFVFPTNLLTVTEAGRFTIDIMLGEDRLVALPFVMRVGGDGNNEPVIEERASTEA